jgi:anion-transporting  ArsA/GET3 family ATPase
MDYEGILEQLNEVDDMIQTFRNGLVELGTIFRNKQITQFIVVATPTSLGMEETKSLIKSLQHERISVSNVVLNKVISSNCSNDEKVFTTKTKTIKMYVSEVYYASHSFPAYSNKPYLPTISLQIMTGIKNLNKHSIDRAIHGLLQNLTVTQVCRPPLPSHLFVVISKKRKEKSNLSLSM